MRRAWQALAAYTAITLVGTWPLVRGLTRDVAWDLGDSLLNMWVLSWDCTQLLALLHGDFSRIHTFFNGNIFSPAPLTLAYAEHLFPQALQILPIYALTKNPILCYNLLFLSTFILSALGMYLFVRELTGSPRAAFVAGLLFAFAPYRLPQSPHLQVLSSQWMPFALYGFRRYFEAVDRGRGGARPLAGASLALLAQNLSCGYYLLYFSPFAAAYVLCELIHRRLWKRPAMWAQLSAAAILVLALTAPFLLPYAEIRDRFGFERSPAEIIGYSADVYSYATATPEQPLWGGVLRAFPKAEGDLFLGFVPALLAMVGLAAWRSPQLPAIPRSRLAAKLPWLAPLLGATIALHLLAAVVTLVNRRIMLDTPVGRLQITNIDQLLIRAVAAGVALLVISPQTRIRARAFFSERGFFVLALVAAIWLSLGLVIQVQGRAANVAAPYRLLFDYVPGFDGVRVPARFAMIAACMLAVLAGYGAAAIARHKRAVIILTVLSIAALSEALVLPFPVNAFGRLARYNAPEPRVYPPSRAPAVYKHVAEIASARLVLAELPLGEPEFDMRAEYYSMVHWRPLLNGYSGFFPPTYGTLALALSDVPRFSNEAMKALGEAGATHVIVHEGAYLESRGSSTTAALLALGARELFRDRSDVLLQLP